MGVMRMSQRIVYAPCDECCLMFDIDDMVTKGKNHYCEECALEVEEREKAEAWKPDAIDDFKRHETVIGRRIW